MQMIERICKCGNLDKFVADETVPISESKDKTAYVLRVSQSCQVVIDYCPMCGGKGGRLRPICGCNKMNDWASLPESCVGYNQEYEEYYLRNTDGSRIVMRFCACCGGRLPESKRGDFYTRPDEAEIKALKTVLAGAQSISDVITRIGLPNKRFRPAARTETEKRIYGKKNVFDELHYTQLGNTFDLIVQEREGEELLLFYFGKPKVEACQKELPS